MPGSREKFTTQIDSKLLATIRELAEREGSQIEVLAEEALADLVKKYRQTVPRPYVMAAYHASHEKYAALYGKLADGGSDYETGPIVT